MTLYSWPAISQPEQFTTVTPSTDHGFSHPLEVYPVLALTEVIGIVVNTKGIPMDTGTLIQLSPSESTGAPPHTEAGDVAQMSSFSCSSFQCWSRSQKIGTVISIMIISLMIIGVLLCGLWCRPKPRADKQELQRKDEEGGKWKERMGITGFLGDKLAVLL